MSSSTTSSSSTLVGFLYYPMPTQPLGWFKKEIKSADDFKGMKYRTVGLSADLFKEMGAAVTILPGGEIVPAHRPRPDRCAPSSTIPPPICCSASRTSPNTSWSEATISRMECLRGHLQQGQVQRLSAGAQVDPAICGVRGHAPTSSGMAYDRYSKDLEEIKARGVNVIKTRDACSKRSSRPGTR